MLRVHGFTLAVVICWSCTSAMSQTVTISANDGNSSMRAFYTIPREDGLVHSVRLLCEEGQRARLYVGFMVEDASHMALREMIASAILQAGGSLTVLSHTESISEAIASKPTIYVPEEDTFVVVHDFFEDMPPADVETMLRTLTSLAFEVRLNVQVRGGALYHDSASATSFFAVGTADQALSQAVMRARCEAN